MNKKTEDDDDEDYEDDPDFKQTKGKAKNDVLAESGAGGTGMDGEEDDYIDEEQMLDVAEKCFMKIAEAIIQQGISVRKAFKDFIIKEMIENDEGEQ